jgi:hypothetical protein
MSNAGAALVELASAVNKSQPKFQPAATRCPAHPSGWTVVRTFSMRRRGAAYARRGEKHGWLVATKI